MTFFRKHTGLALLAGLSALPASAYIRNSTAQGAPLVRRDNSAIQVLVHSSFAVGQTNAQGAAPITATSNPMQAVAAAGGQWSHVTSAAVTFAAPAPTTITNNPSDGNFVVTIQDTPENRSIVGQALAVTLFQYTADGSILDSDVIFNPNVTVNGQFAPFSTDQASGTFDLQSVLVHELGHALGANHSPVISATMFQFQPSCDTAYLMAECLLHRYLAADDVAFVTDAYPAPNAGSLTGSLSGTVALSTGAPVLGALVVAVDTTQGIAVSGLASTQDGTYHLNHIPPGSYQVYAQPANGPLTPANLGGIPNIDSANTSFRLTFAGGNQSPSTVAVAAGGSGQANISVDPTQTGMQVALLGTGSAGGQDWTLNNAAKVAFAGPIDLLLWGPGLNSSITASQIRLLGPGITLRPSTLHLDPSSPINGYVPLRFTVDVQARSTMAAVSVVVVKGTDAAAYSGGLVLLGTTPTITEVDNGFSNIPNSPIQSGTWVTIKGTNLSTTPAPGRLWNATENFPLVMDGTSVTINNKQAFVYYISPTQVNVQAPTDTAVGPVSVVVTNNGVSSATATGTYQSSSPALLQWNGGQYPYALISRGNAFVCNPSVIPGTVSAHAGDALTLWVTGLGQTNPAIPAGQQPATFPAPTTPPTVSVNGTNVTVLGAVLRFAGLYQVNIQLPASLPTGDLPIRISTGNAQSPTGVLINVQ
jgi:uncharacterized protein (TIGR03437 family)